MTWNRKATISVEECESGVRNRARRWGAALLLTSVATAGLGIATSDPASAGTPSCVSHKYYNTASGGCNGNLTRGRDRLDLQCKYIGASYYTRYGAWHDRYADWQETVQCNGGSTAVSAYFEHQN